MDTRRTVLLPGLLAMLLLGCGRLSETRPHPSPDGSAAARTPTQMPSGELSRASGDSVASVFADAPAVGDVDFDDEEALGPATSDSLLTEWLLDSVAEPLDSLETPGAYGTDLPDISDSLAAATEARLPSVDELFDYPVVANRRVLAWIDAYLGRGRRSFENSLRRSGRYLGMARRIFREEGIPQDLAFLAHVESGFRHNAVSPVKALGLWQFMRGTAQLYGLRCESYVDERLDPEKSTRAAARYLRDLFALYDDWYLALAAYNAGAGKVNRAIARAGTRDFWRIAQTRHLRNETRNFVPAILAVTILSKSPGAYGLTTETDPPLVYESVPVDSPTDLRIVARCTGARLPDLQALNPALLLTQTPPGAAPYEVRVPPGLGEQLAREIAKIPPDERLVYLRHKVRQGETLGLLARRYRTTVGAIQDANRLGRRTLIRTGQTLMIPSRNAGDWLGVFDWSGKTSVTHEVRRGETLSHIAQSYGSTVREIQQANHLTNPHRVCVGQLLTIPQPEAVAAVSEEGAASAPQTSVADVGRDPADMDAHGEADHLTGPGTDRDGDPAAHSAEQLAQQLADSLGRVASTAHIVAEARQMVAAEQERLDALDQPPRIYIVRRGDTLSGIADAHGIGVSDLERWNGLSRRRRIYPGQQLMVSPPKAGLDAHEPRVYVVQRGDSLWSIAERHGLHVGQLAEWNGIGANGVIHPGQRLRLY